MNSGVNRSIVNLNSLVGSKHYSQVHNLFLKDTALSKNNTLSNQSFAKRSIQSFGSLGYLAKTFLDKRFCTQSFAKRSMQSQALQAQPLQAQPLQAQPLQAQPLVQVIREITPSADIRKIRRGRKVYQVPRIIPKEKRPLYGIRRLLSVRSDNGTEKEEYITVSSTRIADSKSRVEIKAIYQSVAKPSMQSQALQAQALVQPDPHLSTVQKDKHSTCKVEAFNFIESDPAKKRLPVTRHPFLINKNLANGDKNRDTQKSLSRDSKPSKSPRFDQSKSLYALSHKFRHLYTKAKNVEVENKFSYKKKSVGIPRHTPFYLSTRVNLFARSHVNKRNNTETIKRCTKRDFASRVDNEKYRKQTLLRPQSLPKQSFDRGNLSLAYSLRRVIQTSFSSRGIGVHNKKSGYRTVFANRGSIAMAWWL